MTQPEETLRLLTNRHNEIRSLQEGLLQSQKEERDRIKARHQEELKVLDEALKPLNTELQEHQKIQKYLLGPWTTDTHSYSAHRNLASDHSSHWGSRAWLRVVSYVDTKWKADLGIYNDRKFVVFDRPSQDREKDFKKYSALVDLELERMGYILTSSWEGVEEFVRIYLQGKAQLPLNFPGVP